MRLLRVASAALAVLLAGACSGAPAASSTGSPVELQVYAAASLKAVLAEVRTAYEAAHPGVSLTVSTDSSTALETKIELGAPADVFLSADATNPQKLVDAGLASGSVTLFAGNALTVIVPTSNPARITAPPDLARRGLKIIAATNGVPIQAYTAQWLDKVAALPAYGPGFPAAYRANVVSHEDNVGAVVAKVALGEGDAAVVYVTDARAFDSVATIGIPAGQNVLASDGGVVVRASTHQAAATAFLAWLAGPDGHAILAAFGFLQPSE